MEVAIMKRRIPIIFTLALFILSSTACSVLQKDAAEVKVIPKDKTDVTTSSDSDDTSKPKDNEDTLNTDLDDKLQSLQAGTQEYIKSIIGDRAAEVLSAIKAKDMEKLSQAVHPDKGVRFSPYGHVNTETDLLFTQDQVRNLSSDQKIYTWGSYDGSGEPIKLNFEGYYNKFVYDEDFVNATETGYNKVLGTGNTLVNTLEVYPKAIVVEYYFPGFDPQYQGMDWRSLRLVFEKQDTTWYLVGIAHDQWTI
jgi:hypothetical protein